MRIDGQRVVELDLQGCLLRLIYHKHGIDPDPTADIYAPERIFPKLSALKNLTARHRMIVRGFVKKATIICLNTTSRGRAHSTVGELLGKNKDREFLTKAIYRIEKTDSKGIVRRLLQVHHAIAADFFNEVGPWMMTREGLVMESVMLSFIVAGKPALFLHDAICVKRCDVAYAH